MTEQEQLNQAKESLKKIQEFDPESLRQKDRLGNIMDFSEVIEPAGKLITLYNRLPVSILDDLTEAQRGQIQKEANTSYSRFQSALDFDPKTNTEVRDKIIANIQVEYNRVFPSVMLFIAYATSSTKDLAGFEAKASATLQEMEDDRARSAKALEKAKADVEAILSEVRNAAAEQGVSQQAVHFKQEAEEHQKSATIWQKRTVGMVVILVLMALLSPFIFGTELSTANDDKGILLFHSLTSKILVFAALGYLLVLCGKNYLSHKHNAVVNKHRQNALLTYRALVDAAAEDTNSDIVLDRAAECIFSPQDSGYVKSGAKNPTLSVVGATRQIAKKEEES